MFPQDTFILAIRVVHIVLLIWCGEGRHRLGAAYGLLLLVVIRSVILGDLLLTLFGEALAVAVDVYSGGISHEHLDHAPEYGPERPQCPRADHNWDNPHPHG